MSNSNENDVNKTTLFENINDFDDFRNQFQQAIDVAAQNLGANIDIDNFLKTSGSTFESNGWQFKINNIQLAQSNTNANNEQNLPSEDEEDIKSDVNQNILSEIIAGLDGQKQNKAACTKLFLDNLEAFELKIDSAEILWLLERLKSEDNQENIDRYKNKLSEIFGRYIKKLIHRSEILQLEEAEQKLLTDSLQALASCVVKIIFERNQYGLDMITDEYVSKEFKTNFRKLEEIITQKMLSINSISAKKKIDNNDSEVWNDAFVMLIDETDSLNRLITLQTDLFCDLIQDTKINSRDLPIENKLEIIRFISKESFQEDVPKKSSYLDLDVLTDLDSMFRLTIDKFDYHNLDVPVNYDDLRQWGNPGEFGYCTKPINYYDTLIDRMRRLGGFFKKRVFKLVTELGVPDVIDVIKKCHLSLTSLLYGKYVLKRKVLVGKLLGDTKNILIALLGCYKAKSKINSIIADLWEENFKAQINYFLDKKYNLCQLTDELPGEIQKGIAKDMEKLFTEVKKVFSSEVQPKTAFEVFKILCRKDDNDKLKELIEDNDIFNLFLEYVEQDVKNNRSNEHADLAQFNSLITKIKNKNNSDELSIDDKFKIARIFLDEDFCYLDNLSRVVRKLSYLVLKNNVLGDNIPSKENKKSSAREDSDRSKDGLKLNKQIKAVVQGKNDSNDDTKRKLSSSLSNTIERENKEFEKQNNATTNINNNLNNNINKQDNINQMKNNKNQQTEEEKKEKEKENKTTTISNINNQYNNLDNLVKEKENDKNNIPTNNLINNNPQDGDITINNIVNESEDFADFCTKLNEKNVAFNHIDFSKEPLGIWNCFTAFLCVLYYKFFAGIDIGCGFWNLVCMKVFFENANTKGEAYCFEAYNDQSQDVSHLSEEQYKKNISRFSVLIREAQKKANKNPNLNENNQNQNQNQNKIDQ